MIEKILRSVFGSWKDKGRVMLIQEILQGVELGPVQSVGLMQVLPFLQLSGKESESNGFASPLDEGIEVFTKDYGCLGFRNQTDKPLLVPCHAAYIVPKAAQDHAMAHLGLVKANSEYTFPTAMCVQESQGGYISAGRYELRMLPLALRAPALKERHREDYSKLWHYIRFWNSQLGLSPKGHLEYFFHHFRYELAHFIAEFESLPDQMGAAIVIAGELVGIELVPSPQYWSQVWQAILRDCYGSYAIQFRRQQVKGERPRTRSSLNLESVTSIEDLEKALQEADQKEQRAIEDLLLKESKREVPASVEKEVEGTQVETLGVSQKSRWQGQVLRRKKQICYASLYRPISVV